MTVALKITAKKHTGSHPLRGEEAEKLEIVKPRAGGAILVDASVTDGNSQVALPAFSQQLFGNINSGTAATIDAGKGLLFNVSGDAYVNYNINVQLDNTTGPYTGLFNLYFMWKWGGQNKFLNSLQLDNFNNDAWTINISGLVSMWANELKLYMGVDNAQDEFFWWSGDFQLMVPTTNFPAFVPVVIGSQIFFPPVQPASVPPSNAGVVQPVFTYGNATTPPASAAFPEFTTTFPVPPIAFSNIFTDGASPTTPPHSTTTPPLGGSYNTGGHWGPPIGPALPAVVPPRTFMAMTEEQPSEPEADAPNGAVYDDTNEESEDWFEDTSSRTPEPETPKPRRGRGRRK